MTITQDEITQIELLQQYREVYKFEKVLGGLISWKRSIKKESFGGTVLDIKITKKLSEVEVFVNGKKYIELLK